MQIAPEKGQESATEPVAGNFDIALVVVHGMGNAHRSLILLEWAEPLLERMDWLVRDKIIGATDDHGVTIHDSDLAGDVPIVTATAKFPKRSDRSTPGAPPETVERRIAILEARWSESFVPMTRAQVFRWAVSFMWRAIVRTLALFWHTMVILAILRLEHHLTVPSESLFVPVRVLYVIVDLVRLAVRAVAYAIIWTFIVLLGVVLTPLLPLLSPLLLIPWFKNLAQGAIDTIVESIGDVATWKERPVRASAMRLVVRDALGRAKELVGDGDVHVLAHSQGAAVSTFTLFEELKPQEFNVRRLTTVGAAVVLLGRDRWRGRKDTYTPVANWIARNENKAAEERVAWDNHWATWDPFSAGPIADNRAEARQRWRAAYFPSPKATAALGPEEHAVHNTSQPFLDHGMYFANTVQVVEPTVRHLLGPDFPPEPAPVAYIRNRLTVIDKKSLGLSTVAAVIIAAILPGLPAASAFLALLVTAVATIIGQVIGWFGFLTVVPAGYEPVAAARGAAGFLLDREGDGLSTFGWIVASALLLALLIWLNQLMQGQTERSLVWDRCPLDVRTWLVLTAIPRALYVIGAAVVAWFAILAWSEPRLDDTWLIVSAIVLALVAAFAIAEPRFSPAPFVVPERTDPKERQTLILAPEISRLGQAVRSTAYGDELKSRRKLLAPEGLWATWWAKHFHGWPLADDGSGPVVANTGGGQSAR